MPARERPATSTEAYALGVVQAALEHQRNRATAFALSSIAAVYGPDGTVTGELTFAIGGRNFIVTVTDPTADEDGTFEVAY